MKFHFLKLETDKTENYKYLTLAKDELQKTVT